MCAICPFIWQNKSLLAFIINFNQKRERTTANIIWSKKAHNLYCLLLTKEVHTCTAITISVTIYQKLDSSLLIYLTYQSELIGPTQVKCQLLICSIFYVMNFRHFSEMPQIKFQHFQIMSELHYIKNARNWNSTFDLSWTYVFWYTCVLLSKLSTFLHIVFSNSAHRGWTFTLRLNSHSDY